MDTVLVSHPLCPYVQRAAIVLAEKGVPYERRDIDLAAKPDWFLAVSPLGKTPVLLTGGAALFESAVICEYLDETHVPRLHPADALLRAQQRSWMEFGSTLLNLIGGFYNAADQQALAAKAGEIHARFKRVEAALGEGPYFMGGQFGMVDAVFGPVFRYIDVFDTIADFGMLAGLPRTAAWRAALAARPSVRQAVPAEYPSLLRAFLLRRGAALSARMVS
ncbi:glutathione S-transferase [Duganella caerulea]|uniref:glutathione S-transferase family protein n=1 Tax=Duganella caerulea TaxID=2885762 RepID=UPI0030EA49E7